jgi:serine/threonine protein kinase
VFESESIADLCRKHLNDTPLPPGARVGKSFDPVLEALLMRCLAKDPAARPQSARELGQLLAADPLAEQWSPKHRAAWWAEHRKSAAGLAKPALRPDTSQAVKTVKIEFSDRSP